MQLNIVARDAKVAKTLSLIRASLSYKRVVFDTAVQGESLGQGNCRVNMTSEPMREDFGGCNVVNFNALVCRSAT